MSHKLFRWLVPATVCALVLVSCRTVTARPGHSGEQAPETASAARVRAVPLRDRAAAPSVSGESRTQPLAIDQDCPEQNPAADPGHAGRASLDLSAAMELHAQGRVDEALAVGLALLDQVMGLQLDSPSLRLLLGEWAIEAGNGVLAEQQLTAALAAMATEGDVEQRISSQLRAARSLAYGSDAVALAEAQALFEGGAWAAADEQLKQLFATAADEEVMRQGEALRDTINRQSVARVEAAMGRVDELLAQDWPRVEVAAGVTEELDGDAVLPMTPDLEIGSLLDGIETLPQDTWLPADVSSRRTSLAMRQAASSLEGQVVLEREWQATLDEARTLVAANRYRDARALYATLEGTPHQAAARSEAGAAADALVKEERLRAGRLFVAARKVTLPEERATQLRAVRDLLSSLLADFPRSRYADRVADNLAAVEAELAKLSVE